MKRRPIQERLMNLSRGFPTNPRDPFLGMDDGLISAGWDMLPADRDILDKFKLKSSEAVPAEIRPYELSSLKWEIEGPINNANLFLYGESIFSDPNFLRRIPIESVGTQTVSPLVTTAYTLKAERGLAKKSLGKITVNVNTDEIKVGVMPGPLIEEGIVTYLQQMFEGIADINLKKDDVEALLMDGGLGTSIPFELEIEHFFNADVDIDFYFHIFGHRSRMYTKRLVTELGNVETDVSWHWLEHLLSLVAPTSISQAACEALLKVMIESMMARQLENNLTNALVSAPIFGVRDLLKSMGGQGKPYLLHSLEVVPQGIDVLGCPDPRP